MRRIPAVQALVAVNDRLALQATAGSDPLLSLATSEVERQVSDWSCHLSPGFTDRPSAKTFIHRTWHSGQQYPGKQTIGSQLLPRSANSQTEWLPSQRSVVCSLNDQLDSLSYYIQGK
jgi:hypothetical protein